MNNIYNKNLISFGIISLFVFALNLLVLLPTSAKAFYYVGFENGVYVGYFKDSGYYNNNTTNTNNNTITTNPTPFISSISPNSAKINTTVTITVNGNGFVPGSVVRWNSIDLLTTYVNPNTLKAEINSYELNTKGDYLITVFNPAPSGGYSNASLFTVKNNTTVASTTRNTSRTTSSTSTTNVVNTNNSETASQPTSGSEVSQLAGNALFGYNGFFPSSIFQWLFFFILILLAVILWRKLYTANDPKTPLKHA